MEAFFQLKPLEDVMYVLSDYEFQRPYRQNRIKLLTLRQISNDMYKTNDFIRGCVAIDRMYFGNRVFTLKN